MAEKIVLSCPWCNNFDLEILKKDFDYRCLECGKIIKFEELIDWVVERRDEEYKML